MRPPERESLLWRPSLRQANDHSLYGGLFLPGVHAKENREGATRMTEQKTRLAEIRRWVSDHWAYTTPTMGYIRLLLNLLDQANKQIARQEMLIAEQMERIDSLRFAHEHASKQIEQSSKKLLK